MTPKQVLLDAADIVEFHWCQGEFARNDSGRPVSVSDNGATEFCAVGACLRADPSQASLDAAIYYLRRFLSSEVTPWNDAPGRTAKEVAAAMRACAAQMEV